MNKTQHMKRRPLVAMPGYALALTMRQQPADRRDAARMRHLTHLVTIKPMTRMLALAGLVKF